MKKLLLMMSILLSAGMFCACSSDDEMNVNGGGELLQISDSTLIPDDGVVLSPIKLYDESGICTKQEDCMILDFFNYQLPIGKSSNSFFIDSDKNECYVINSLEELKSIYKGNVEIPEIDFERYTLVIGQEILSDFNYPVYKQDLMFSDHKCHLTLYVPDFDLENNTTQYFYYWALYPKFYTEGISVGFIKEKSVIKSVEDAIGCVWINPFKGEEWINNPFSEPYDGYLIYDDRSGILSDNYCPINLPDDFVVDEVKGTKVKFSGSIVEMTLESREQLQLVNTGDYYYFVYLTKIERID